MQLKTCCLLLLCFITTNSFAQQEENSTTDVTKVTFFYPGLSYEKSVGARSTLYGHAYVNPVFSISYFSSPNGAGIHTDFDPKLQVQYRYYYNYKQRSAKEKRTEKNSLNYISPSVATTFTRYRLSNDYPAQMDRHPVYSLGLLWGLQRNYPKRFSLDLNMGLQYSFVSYRLQGGERPVTFRESELVPVLHINLGFWLNRQPKA